jgi:hypothetical protein
MIAAAFERLVGVAVAEAVAAVDDDVEELRFGGLLGGGVGGKGEVVMMDDGVFYILSMAYFIFTCINK